MCRKSQNVDYTDTAFKYECIIIHAPEYTLKSLLSFADLSLTHSNVTNVLASITTKWLPVCLRIPGSVRDKILDQHKNDSERRQLLVTFYVQYSPYSTSWTFLASTVHYMEEITAEVLVRKYIKGTPGVYDVQWHNILW